MNLILFTEAEIRSPLPRHDARAKHILEILRFGVGDAVDVGVINGPAGKATIVEIGESGLVLDYDLTRQPSPLYPVSMIIGLPRPPSSRRILGDLTSMGVQQMHFVATDKGEKSYLRSRLWAEGEFERLLREGAQQAFSTYLPDVRVHAGLEDCFEHLVAPTDRVALDNYEAALRLQQFDPTTDHCTLAVGSERGWSARERDLLREAGFQLMGMGTRVLKTETACIAGLAVVLGKLQRP